LEDDIGSVLEGGTKLDVAITWARSRSVQEILEFSISLESQLYDLYIRLQRREKEKSSSRFKIFSVISGEEKNHLERLVELFESMLGK
jgi:rubrerythrin